MLETLPMAANYLINSSSLPAAAIIEDVNSALDCHLNVVVTAPPGAGKSTLLPLSIAHHLAQGKVLVLEPRRLAARQIAERMAWMLGEAVGKSVGYRMRFESVISQETRIEVITEGVLTRMLIDDPTLEGISAVIFDEFHERSLNSDVAFALTREAQRLVRDDLHIIVMSATIDSESICRELDAPLVESEGRMFPVEIIHTDDLPWQQFRDAMSCIARQVAVAHGRHEGDILVFLPGEAEIHRVEELLQNQLGDTRICPLYGQLAPNLQQTAIRPSNRGERKVVLSTPIAETSLTIEGVRIVIDAGRYRKMVFDPRSALSHMETVPISMDMAQQRTGRAGRVAPGVCYRLWSQATEHNLRNCRLPEIEEADLCSTLLDVAAWGESNIEKLPWLTTPPRTHLLQAKQTLCALGALDEKGLITPHGKRLAALPCHPRIGQLLLHAQNMDALQFAANIAAILEAGNIPAKSGADIQSILDELNFQKGGTWSRIGQMSEHFIRLAKGRIKSSNNTKYSAGYFLASAYPERIAKALPERYCAFRMADGNEVTIDAQDKLASYEWLAVAHVHAGGRIHLAAPITEAELEHFVCERDTLAWDNKAGVLLSRRERRIGKLLLDEKPATPVNREEVWKVLAEAAQKWGTSMFDFSDEVRALQLRIAQVNEWHAELALPDVTDEAILRRTEEWLPLYGGKANSRADLKNIDLCQVIWSLLSYDQQCAVDRLAPTHLTLPCGKSAKIEYRTGAEMPILRARLQDCFGLKETPRVDDGRHKVLMELLSPGFKPVQLTADLPNFWSTTYFDVRKELKRRYPKHAWPDDPLSNA